MFNKDSILFYIILAFILVICLKIYRESDAYNLKCIISNVDGETYCVRDRAKLEIAADLLATVTQKCKDLVIYVGKKYPEDEDVQRLLQKFNPTKISETLPTSEYTAYSENKGEKLAFCLNRTKNNNNNLIDENTLMFVAIHEMAHITTDSIGHDKAFWDNFKYLLEQAVDAKLYIPIDYKKERTDYCGMTISDNPYFK